MLNNSTSRKNCSYILRQSCIFKNSDENKNPCYTCSSGSKYKENLSINSAGYNYMQVTIRIIEEVEPLGVVNVFTCDTRNIEPMAHTYTTTLTRKPWGCICGMSKFSNTIFFMLPRECE